MAETRETQVIEDVVNSTEIENPRTTEEAILAQVIAGDEVTINARTRLQKYLSQLTSGGGNPNSMEIIEGTLANPWGDVIPRILLAQIGNLSASAFMVIDATAIGISYPVNVQASFASASSNLFWFASVGDISDSGNTNAVCVHYTSEGRLNYIYALVSGQYVDLTQYESLLPTTLTIIHHPLPEGSI